MQTKLHKFNILVTQHKFNDWILLYNNNICSRKNSNSAWCLFWDGENKLFLMRSCILKPIHQIFSHSVMLTNTVVFPHVVSLLLNPGGQRGYRNPRLPVKVCCVWCSSGIWFLTPFSTVLYLCPLVPMTPPLHLHLPHLEVLMFEMGMTEGHSLKASPRH